MNLATQNSTVRSVASTETNKGFGETVAIGDVVGADAVSTSEHVGADQFSTSEHVGADAVSTSEHVVRLLRSPAGIASLRDLAAIDPFTLSSSARIDYLSALEKQTGWLQALLQRAIIAVAGDEPTESEGALSNVDEAQREEVATALRLSGSTAQTRIDTARTLTQFLPETCAALSAGEISTAQAHVIARESAEAIRHGLADHEIRRLELEAIAHSEFHTPSQVANKMRTLIAKIAPREFEEVVQEAVLGRMVSFYPQPHGMAQIVALLPAIEAQTVMLAIDKLARKNQNLEKLRIKESMFDSAGVVPSARQYASTKQQAKLSEHERSVSGPQANSSEHGVESSDPQANSNERGVDSSDPQANSSDHGAITSHPDHTAADHTAADPVELEQLVMSLDQHRADALAQIANSFLAENIDESQSHSRPTTINLTIDLPTLLGLSENPGILAGYGAIPASIARELAVDGKWRRFVTDPITGNLLDYGRDTYSPPQALVNFLMARDRVCRFPGCRQPARLADIDHAQPWDAGGGTSPENMGMLCRRHHRMKTHGKWHLESFADGACRWTSPTGRTYLVAARPINDIP